MPQDGDVTSPVLDRILAVGVATVALTEGLSLVHALDRATVLGAWALLAAVALAWRRPWRWRWRAPHTAAALVLGVTAVTAVLSPPNGWDAVSYHMSRVVYWIQNGSVAHFPTHDLRQVVFSPFAEFCVLHLQLLWGGDRLANLVQWAAFAGCLWAVAELVRRGGGSPAAVGAAVVFAATLPTAIVQASGTENDLVLALWLLVAVLAVEEHLRTGTTISALKVGAAAGLLALTKGTGYVLGAPVLAGWGVLLLARSASARRALGAIACAAALALALNAGHYLRNLGAFGSPLGDAIFVDYHQNETRSPRVLASNLIRNASFHLATPSPALNAAIVRGVGAIHALIGIAAADARTTLLEAPFSLEFTTHEDRSSNPLHFAAIVGVLGLVAARRVRLGGPGLACAAAAVAGFALLSWLVKWQTWGARFQISLFLLMAVPCGIVAARGVSPRALRGLSAVFVIASLPWLLGNASRPLVGVTSHQRERDVFRHSRAELYMANWPLDPLLRGTDRVSPDWPMQASYVGLTEALERSGCRDVGLIKAIDSWDYPLWALARQRGFTFTLRQIRVSNATADLATDPAESVCAVVTLGSPLALDRPTSGPPPAGREVYRLEPVTLALTRP
jgi:hypothetical protein